MILSSFTTVAYEEKIYICLLSRGIFNMKMYDQMKQCFLLI